MTDHAKGGARARRLLRHRGGGRDRDRAENVSLPRGLVLAGAWSWRLLAIGAALAVVVFLIIELRLLVIPIFVAVLFAALLVPFVDFLRRLRWPHWLAVVVTFFAFLIAVGALVTLVVWQVRSGFDDVRRESLQAWDSFQQWLGSSPLGFSPDQVQSLLDQLGSALQQDRGILVSGAVSVGSSLGHFVAGVLLTLFATLFILIDGRSIWRWIVRVFPRRARAAVDGAGHAGWTTLVSFARMQVFVAFIDAVGIGIGAVVLQLPLAIPIAVLVFLGSFIPIVGAIATGALAVFVALVFHGWVAALIMLAIVLAVHQLEGHVLQPLIMGSAVKVHPLAVVLAVAGGTFLAGIPGALFAVPTVAVVNVMVHHVAGGAWRGHPDPSYTPGTGIWREVPGRLRRSQ